MFLFNLYRLYKLAVLYIAPLFFYPRLAWSKAFPERKQSRLQLQAGQGLVEYALVLVLVAIVVIAILTLLGPQIGRVFFEVTCSLDGGTVVPYDDRWIDCLLDPDGTNAPPNRLFNFDMDTGAVVDDRG